jgi:hypothetical protein
MILRDKLPKVYMFFRNDFTEYVFVKIDRYIGENNEGKFDKVKIVKEIETKYIAKEIELNTNIPDEQNNKKLSTKDKGRIFEEYVVSLIDFDNDFTFKEWRGDKYINGKYPNSNTYPDLQISYDNMKDKIPFVLSLECKYRSGFYEDHLNIGAKQLENYRKFAMQEKQKVSVILGVGGPPSNPDKIYLVPLKKFNTDGSISQLTANTYKRDKSKLKFDLKTQTIV